jgi:hypothetical protein
MSDPIPILVADFLFDEENPRLTQPNVGQRETFRRPQASGLVANAAGFQQTRPQRH